MARKAKPPNRPPTKPKSKPKPPSRPKITPGEQVTDSGIWESDKSKRRATLVEGEPAPPTPQRGEKWKQVVDTNPEKKK